jgi:hypothetical protein
MEIDYCLIQNIVDTEKYKAISTGSSIDTDIVASAFEHYLSDQFSDEQFSHLLACSGFIPDLYPSDSSEETLYTKLIEVMVSNWAIRMGYHSKYLKEKSSYEDVNITIGDKVIVCDAKSFRLGRSQAAPNVKDFLKLEDIRKWLGRYTNKLGGLVTYPDTHEWATGSDAYLYCSTKSCPTVMLPYIYLAMILHYKSNFETDRLIELWDYERLFPHPLEKKVNGGNRVPYWYTINKELMRVLCITKQELNDALIFYKGLQQNHIKQILRRLTEKKEKIIIDIQNSCNQMNEKQVREELESYKIEKETREVNNFIDRIKKFRIE